MQRRVGFSPTLLVACVEDVETGRGNWARESAWFRALILFRDENAINTKRQASKDLKRLEKKVLSRDLSKSCPLYQYFARINIIVTWKF